MNTGSQKLHLVDKGETVQIVIPCQQRRIGTPIIKSSTTQLQVRDSAGDLLLDVPQLYSTVDASKTSWLQNDESLTMTLHKLSANERWTSLEPEEIPVATSRQADSEGAMEARDLVRQLFEAALYGRLADLQDIAPQVSTSGLSSVKDGNGRNALHFAAQGGQVETASYLIVKEGIDEDSQDEQGETPLGLAAGAGQVETARLLIEQGADLTKAGPMKPQPLHRAAATGNSKVVSLFLEAKADLEAPSESGTPLLWAAGSGSCPVVTQLLDAGADPNAQTPEGVSAMLMAAAAGNAEIVGQLARHGANPSLPATGGVTALHAAAELGDLVTAQALLNAGADPDAADNDSGAKPIHAAAYSGHTRMVELLLPLTQPRKDEQWTVESLMAETSSAGSPASPQGASMAPRTAHRGNHNPELGAQCKKEGDKAFASRDFQAAEAAYSTSLTHDPDNHLVWANRSAARLKLDRPKEALEDARHSRELDPKYLKAWYREGEAAKCLEEYEAAAQAFYEAYTLDPSSTLMAQEFQAAVAMGRRQHAERLAKQRPS